ncbi:MAG: bifunctional oligoribonuclease/PAP phosphatase NrnA [Desulfovibrio sp.]|jgi:phosphoesterase RecJ-like protein|nr:bifunctional oligoribonuclease/PAP phosphatase NrnA [Desulfovibrio sp.]
MHEIFQRLAEELNKAERVLLTTHVVPDGDAVGSTVALAHIVRHLGCETRMLMRTGLPADIALRNLPTPVLTRCAGLGDFVPDIAFFVDCGDERRAGPEMGFLARNKSLPPPEGAEADAKGGSADKKILIVNIDHHADNPGFGDINLVQHGRAATSELIGLFAEYLGLSLSGDLGEAVYLGLVTDTGNFTYANTSADSLALGARIFAAGLNVADFSRRCDNNWSLARMHLWGCLMRAVTLSADGSIACCAVPRSLMDESGLGNDDLEGFASWLRRIKGVRVGLFVREDGPDNCKISLRSMGDFNVRAVTAVFDGGGHISAAGATVRLPLQEATRVVIEEIQKRL